MSRAIPILTLDEKAARGILDQLCRDSGRVFFTKHAEDRMRERGITRLQVMTCLKNGVFVEGPAKSAKGSWTFKMRVRSAGDEVCVVAALDMDKNGNFALVITTYLQK